MLRAAAEGQISLAVLGVVVVGLVLAERAGLRVHEVPVDWVDDPDSRVAIGSTALADLRGVWRLLWSRSRPKRAQAMMPGQRSVP